MPWRLVLTLLIFGIMLLFIGFNLDNRTDISLVFHTFEDIPVFVSLFISFISGALIMVPFTIGKRKKRSAKKDDSKKQKSLPSAENSGSGSASEKKEGSSFFSGKKKKKDDSST